MTMTDDMRQFLQTIIDAGGHAGLHMDGGKLLPIDNAGEAARNACRRYGFAVYEDRHWHITAAGRAAVAGSTQQSAP